MRGRTIPVLTAKIAVAVLISLAFAGSALASHWATEGWYDRHYGYPSVPNGLTAINSVFGTRCTSDSNYNKFVWGADGTAWNVNFHKKLGGAAVPGWYAGNGGLSTNLFYDVRGHIGNSHWDAYVLGGIGAYNCRLKSGSTTEYSTHAWGIAIDMNWNHEHVGHCHNHTINANVATTFQNHGWYWGLAFCDAEHFQYATGY
jgi:hypothetical protein